MVMKKSYLPEKVGDVALFYVDIPGYLKSVVDYDPLAVNQTIIYEVEPTVIEASEPIESAEASSQQ